MSVIGYKGFDSKLRGMGMQFEVGKTFEVDGDPKTVRNGMHFCTEPCCILNDYPRRCGNRYCIVEALGQISTDNNLNTRASTNKMRIIEEISEDEMVRIQKEYRDSLDKKIRSGIDEFLRADAKQ